MQSLLDQSNLTQLAERLVDAARRAGADQADALAVRSVALSVEVRDGAVEESQRSEGDDLGLRVIVGHKQAVVSTNDLEGVGFDTLAERAVAMARSAPDDRFAGLAVRGVTTSDGASASAYIGGLVLVTSHGFHGATIASRHGISMTAIAGDGTGMERDYDFSSTLHASDLEKAQAIGRRAGERAVERLNPRKVTTRRVPVVLDSRISGSIVGHVASAANGSSVARKTSFLREKLGQKIFASGIHIIDDPLRPRGLRSRPFDVEGIAGRSRHLVEDGMLKTWILDCATARELGLRTTGHAQRGVSSTPAPGASNLHMTVGSKSPHELIADIADGFYVTDMIGMGVNLVTGDYSRGASGFWIENGERTYPVSEVTIAGHLSEMFASLVPASDLVFRYGTNAPTLRIEGMTVAGQ